MAVIKTSHYKDLPPQQCSAVCKLFPALTASGQSIACAVCIRGVSVHPRRAPRAPWQCRGATEGPGEAPAPLGMEGQQGCRDGERLPVHVLVCAHRSALPGLDSHTSAGREAQSTAPNSAPCIPPLHKPGVHSGEEPPLPSTLLGPETC